MGSQLELFEERAAIKEFDAGFPRGIANAQAHRETIVIVSRNARWKMEREGFSSGKMLRTTIYRKLWACPPPEPDGREHRSECVRVGNHSGGGLFLRSK
jgi:hypothetical protein